MLFDEVLECLLNLTPPDEQKKERLIFQCIYNSGDLLHVGKENTNDEILKQIFAKYQTKVKVSHQIWSLNRGRQREISDNELT